MKQVKPERKISTMSSPPVMLSGATYSSELLPDWAQRQISPSACSLEESGDFRQYVKNQTVRLTPSWRKAGVELA
ncbi:MAG: hypothetical protein G3I08_09655 [Ferrovum sp.]|jgi:hypothetical protein|nr:hypothetical protein [Ferrovum sp.]